MGVGVTVDGGGVEDDFHSPLKATSSSPIHVEPLPY